MSRIFSFEKSVGAVIYLAKDNEPAYLLVRYRSGQWDFVKGHAESGESELETLRREIKEETGLSKIDVTEGFRKTVRYFYRAKGNEKIDRAKSGRAINILKTVAYYLAGSIESDVSLNYENSEFAWLGYADAKARLSNEGSLSVLKAADGFIRRNKET